MNKLENIHILLIEDNSIDAQIFQRMLVQTKGTVFNIEVVSSLEQGFTYLKEKEKNIDIIVTDLNLENSFGIDTFRALYKQAKDLPIIVLTGAYMEEELGIQAVKEGAQDYLYKNNINSTILYYTIRYAIIRKKLHILHGTLDYIKGIIDTIHKPLIVLDKELRIVLASRSFYQFFKLESKEADGQFIYELENCHLDTSNLRQLLYDVLLKNTSFDNLEIECNLPQIGKCIMLLNAQQIYQETDSEQLILLEIEDITKRKKAEEDIKYIGYHDKLTDLYNWGFFNEQAIRLDTERQLPISIIMIDVNNLKLTNDAFGHQEGDKLLKMIADYLKDISRKEDIVSRWGGDEFVILLPKTNRDIAEEIGKRIKTICPAIKHMPLNYYYSISIGVAVKEQKGQSISNIIKEAEERMYKDKLLDGSANRKKIIDSMIDKIENTETREHIERMTKLSEDTGENLGLNRKQLEELRLCANLHDIGKTTIPAGVLEQVTPLTSYQWTEIKKHADIGYRIVRSIPEFIHIAETILYHHERWDGMGYPQGLKGEEIPFLSRVLTILDAYDVMTHERQYKPALTQEESLIELRKNAGSQFDPELVELFIKQIENRDTKKALI